MAEICTFDSVSLLAMTFLMLVSGRSAYSSVSTSGAGGAVRAAGAAGALAAGAAAGLGADDAGRGMGCGGAGLRPRLAMYFNTSLSMGKYMYIRVCYKAQGRKNECSYGRYETQCQWPEQNGRVLLTQHFQMHFHKCDEFQFCTGSGDNLCAIGQQTIT